MTYIVDQDWIVANDPKKERHIERYYFPEEADAETFFIGRIAQFFMQDAPDIVADCILPNGRPSSNGIRFNTPDGILEMWYGAEKDARPDREFRMVRSVVREKS